MAQKRRKGRGVSWELVGIIALLMLFMGGIMWWIVVSSGVGGVTAPEFSSLRPETAPTGEPAESGTPAAESPDAGPERPAGVDKDGRPYLGQDNAKVVVYEFADFQCPHCKQFTIEDAPVIKNDYVDKGAIKLVFVNFPFMGDESNQAARAALCASEQGKFWDMHDWLFANQALAKDSGGFSRDRLKEIATSAGLDGTVFEACLGDPAILERVKKDREYANGLGVESTPSFLIGKQLLAGPSLVTLREAIDQAVAAAE